MNTSKRVHTRIRTKVRIIPVIMFHPNTRLIDKNGNPVRFEPKIGDCIQYTNGALVFITKDTRVIVGTEPGQYRNPEEAKLITVPAIRPKVRLMYLNTEPEGSPNIQIVTQTKNKSNENN